MKTSNPFSRRDFLRTCGTLGLGLAAAAALPVPAWAGPIETEGVRVCRTRPLMGTFVAITVVHGSGLLGEEAAGRAFEAMEELIPIFDRFDPASALSVLNHTGRLSGAPNELCGLLQRAKRLNTVSNGAFDVTVKPLMDLFGERLGEGRAGLSPKDLAPVLELVDSSALRVDGNRIRLDKTGMGLTLDGAAKGLIVDAASLVLRRLGAVNHLIDAGGDIRVSGCPSQGRPWTVAIENPDKSDPDARVRGPRRHPQVLDMTSGAIATSGGYEVFFDPQRLFHHIVDPHTGLSPKEVKSVSVRAQSAQEADALSTAIFASHPRQGLDLADSLAGVECLILAAGGAACASRGWTA
ncbi:MAG: FAD:protein FMN transferase [Desulfovibrionaceae bacterium]|nr:FAD:protein FMN transferase [Desulfovibrionaceae bacterium]